MMTTFVCASFIVMLHVMCSHAIRLSYTGEDMVSEPTDEAQEVATEDARRLGRRRRIVRL